MCGAIKTLFHAPANVHINVYGRLLRRWPRQVKWSTNYYQLLRWHGTVPEQARILSNRVTNRSLSYGTVGEHRERESKVEHWPSESTRIMARQTNHLLPKT